MLTQAALKSILDYDQDTGAFTWKVRLARRTEIGAVAGTINNRGYIIITLYGKRYLAHRLAWLHIHGEFPLESIDHINGNVADNKLSNLRNVTQSANMQNQRNPRSDNTSGFLGVTYSKRNNKWQASIKLHGKNKTIGLYKTAELAHQAYLEVKRQLHEGCTI